MCVDQRSTEWQNSVNEVEVALKGHSGRSILYAVIRGSSTVAVTSPYTRLIARTDADGYKSMIVQAALQLTKQIPALVVITSTSDVEGYSHILRALDGAPVELLDDVSAFRKLGTDTFLLTSMCLQHSWKDICL